MPEGDYSATYSLTDGWWQIKIPGGIASPGKAEDAHNVGMDGTWAADSVHDERTPTIEAATAQIAKVIIAERGSFVLPFPMTVGEAEKLGRFLKAE